VEFPLIATNILYTLLQEYEFVDINIPADESTYISEMLQLFCGKSCSFDFQVGDIGCHKAILASRCEFFNAMLSSSMIETRQSKADTVLLEGNALGCFIQYLYTGESDHIKDIWDAVEILDAMEYYFLDKVYIHKLLARKCKKIIIEVINDLNCVSIYFEAFARGKELVTLEARSYISSHASNETIITELCEYKSKKGFLELLLKLVK